MNGNACSIRFSIKLNPSSTSSFGIVLFPKKSVMHPSPCINFLTLQVHFLILRASVKVAMRSAGISWST